MNRRRATTVIGILAFAGLLVFGGCRVLDLPDMDHSDIDTYTSVAGSKPVSIGGGPVADGLQRWNSLISDFSRESMSGQVATVYADEFFFNDTLKTFTEPEALERYFLETADALVFGKVEFQDVAISGDDVYVRWRMTYQSKKLRKREEIITIGMSHLRFNGAGEVVLHQDFWDSTRGIFEHVPVIGTGIRAVKKRL